VTRLGTGTLRGSASVALVQEYVHLGSRRTGGRALALAEAAEIAGLLELHPFQTSYVPTLLALLDAHPRLDAQDAVHAATAINCGFGAIVSTDRAFDDVGGLERIDPLDAGRIAELGAP
jgi:predicted nucleic acid-binding protein